MRLVLLMLLLQFIIYAVYGWGGSDNNGAPTDPDAVCKSEQSGPNARLTKNKRGCDGARWSSGSWAEEYCRGSSKVQSDDAWTKEMQWFRRCCTWTNNQCKVKTPPTCPFNGNGGSGKHTQAGDCVITSTVTCSKQSINPVKTSSPLEITGRKSLTRIFVADGVHKVFGLYTSLSLINIKISGVKGDPKYTQNSNCVINLVRLNTPFSYYLKLTNVVISENTVGAVCGGPFYSISIDIKNTNITNNVYYRDGGIINLNAGTHVQDGQGHTDHLNIDFENTIIASNRYQGKTNSANHAVVLGGETTSISANNLQIYGNTGGMRTKSLRVRNSYISPPVNDTCHIPNQSSYGKITSRVAMTNTNCEGQVYPGCTLCPAGTYSNSDVGKATQEETCVNCGYGNYSSPPGGAISCMTCGRNMFTPDRIQCKACENGKVAARGSIICYDLDSMLKQSERLVGNMNEISAQQGNIIKAVALSNAKSNEVKQKANGLIAKLSLDWATQDVINEAQKLRNQLSALPEYNVTHHCEQEKERLAYGVLRTGIIVPSDAEIDNKYCLNENRNRLISSFCNFRPRFIKLLQEKLYPRLPSTPKYTGRDLWPNICCKKDNFQSLKTCNDASGKVPRSHIVPFALAQGGNLTVKNVYGEIVDMLKKDGYLQTGMKKVVDGIKNGDKLKAKLNSLFETTLLCGPREFGLPTNEAIRLCELFYPYEHMLGTYYNEVNALLEPLQRRRRRRILGVWSRVTNSVTALMNSASAIVFGDADAENFGMQKLQDEIDMLKKNDAVLEKKDAISHNEIQDLKRKDAISRHKIQRLEKKDAISRHKIQRLEKKDAIIQSQANKTNTFLAVLKRNEKRKRRLGSASPLADELCPFVTMGDRSTYRKDIDTLCAGYAHIDLNHPGTVVNVAIMLPWDIPAKLIPELREKARYEISDDCPTPMFTANDISLQNIDGADLFIVQLDATSPNGYLKKELPQCGAVINAALKPHIPKTTIDVKIWRDHEDCCKDTKDYKVCKEIGCLPADDPNGIEPVKDQWTNLQVGYHYKVIGTTYTATCDNKPNSNPCGSNARRRNLLQDVYGNSGERL